MDAVVLPDGEGAVDTLSQNGHAMEFVKDQYRHCKPILALGLAASLLDEAGIPTRASFRRTGSGTPSVPRRPDRCGVASVRRGLDEALGISHGRRIRRPFKRPSAVGRHVENRQRSAVSRNVKNRQRSAVTALNLRVENSRIERVPRNLI